MSYASNPTHAIVRLTPSEPSNQVRSICQRPQLIDSSALSNPTTPSHPRAHSTLITLSLVSISDSIQPCLPPKRKTNPPLPLALVLNTIRQLQRASLPATIATGRTPNQKFLKTPTCQKICGTPCDDTFSRSVRGALATTEAEDEVWREDVDGVVTEGCYVARARSQNVPSSAT